MLQILARHSTHAKQAPAIPPAAAAPAPAQQHAMIQLRTMMPPNTPQTAGSAVWGALLPTTGTVMGVCTAGSGASGTLGRAPATVSVVPVKPFPTVLVAPVTS